MFVVNTKKLKPEEYPKTWLDLAHPRFKGLVSMADIEKSGSAYMQLNTFLAIYGDNDAGWGKFKNVFQNTAISTSSGAVPRFVNDGEAVVGVTLEDNAYLFVKGGGPVAIVYPEDGTSAIADGMALVKRAPNPAAGKAFIDWALSAPVQQTGRPGAGPPADPQGHQAAGRLEAHGPDQARPVRHQAGGREAEGLRHQVARAGAVSLDPLPVR